jgi:hypothetical protein
MKSSGVENMLTLFQNINEGTFLSRYTSLVHDEYVFVFYILKGD